MQKIWNWQQKDWPNFKYDFKLFESFEKQFLVKAGVSMGLLASIDENEKKDVIITLLSEEAYKTFKIEGEILERDSVQSSIKRHFGLKGEVNHNLPRENGIAEMLIDLYHNYDDLLSHEILYNWHKMLFNARRDLENIGEYRTHPEPMQIISNPFQKMKVHFEAPMSRDVKKEMDQFITWFNGSEKTLPALVRASITHLYFESIHPFEDGNGRIGRALVEKALAQCLNKPTLIALSRIIEKEKKNYYKELEKQSKHNKINDWIGFFAEIILKAQDHTIKEIEFIIKRTKFFDRIKNHINERQNKAISRMLREGRKGFKGGLSAQKYMAITKTTASTATRDLKGLVDKQILSKSGDLKSTRYSLLLNNTKSHI